MKSTLSKEEVKYIAALSRISLEENEIERLSKDLGDILGYIEKLKKPDVSAVQPTTHVLPITNVYREDQVRPSLPHNEALSIAPSRQRGFFKVPQVIE